MTSTIDTHNLMELLWEDGIDSDFGIDGESMYLQVSCFGQVIRVFTVWEDSDDMFLDVGDINLYMREDGEYRSSVPSGSQNASDLHEELLGMLSEA